MKKPHLCDTCFTGEGYLWPIASNSYEDHDYVERCDECGRFTSDEVAAEYILERLRATYGATIHVVHGKSHVGCKTEQPFIDITDGRGRVFSR